LNFSFEKNLGDSLTIMPMESFVPGAVGYIPTVIKYLNPAKSPFYTVMVVATFLVGACHHLVFLATGISREQFYAFLAPIAAIMALGLYISVSVKSNYELSPEEHQEQIRFTRSFCISVALICMVWVGHTYDLLKTREVLVSYCSSLAQLLVFTIYTLLHFGKEQPPTRSNLIQLGLITGAF
jgi:cytochrome bd-type quinol oxidase subunit 2